MYESMKFSTFKYCSRDSLKRNGNVHTLPQSLIQEKKLKRRAIRITHICLRLDCGTLAWYKYGGLLTLASVGDVTEPKRSALCFNFSEAGPVDAGAAAAVLVSPPAAGIPNLSARFFNFSSSSA